jgi:hypothetical protein
MIATERLALGLLVLGSVAGTAACRHGKTSVAPPERADQQSPPSYPEGTQELPNVMRPGLRAAMGRHAEHASALTRAAALGLHEETVAHATSLLEEPKLARPLPDSTGTLNEELPPKLFEIDDAFRSALVGLREAANARDDELTITRFASVLRTCRDCHRSFAKPPDTPAEAGDAGSP